MQIKFLTMGDRLIPCLAYEVTSDPTPEEDLERELLVNAGLLPSYMRYGRKIIPVVHFVNAFQPRLLRTVIGSRFVWMPDHRNLVALVGDWRLTKTQFILQPLAEHYSIG